MEAMAGTEEEEDERRYQLVEEEEEEDWADTDTSRATTASRTNRERNMAEKERRGREECKETLKESEGANREGLRRQQAETECERPLGGQKNVLVAAVVCSSECAVWCE